MKIIFFGVSAGVFSAAAHAADISNNETGFKKVWNWATVSDMNLIDNIDFTTDFNAVAGFEKRVAGNGFSLNGNGVDGVLEANGKTVSLTNLTVKGFANKDKGILYAENANIFATDAVFTDNAAAIRFKSNETAANKLTLRAENSDVVFSQNGLSALNVRGGAVFMDGGELTATANDGKRIDFSNNTAHQGGALYIENAATAALANALFKSNEATLNNGYGGAIYAASAVLTMDKTDFVNNKASQSGGAVYADRSVLEASNAEFSDNTATIGGALNGYGAQMTIRGNSSFTDNTATMGGAIFANLSDLKITGGEFAGNKANLGGAIYLQNSSAELTDADFTGNTASNGAAIYFKATSSGKTLKINAENKDVTFKNNGANGLFVYSTKQTSVTLSAAAGKTLTFDDAISFNGQTATYRPLLILDGAGTVALNGVLTGRFSLDVNAADAILNLSGDNRYDKLEVVNLTGNSVLKVKVDFNAADGSSDFLDVDSIESNGSAALTDINITADGDADSLQWLKGTGIGGIADASADALKIMTSGGWTYTFVKTGLGTFGVSRMESGSLPAAIADETIARFDLTADYASPADLGVLQGADRTFVLDGNGHALNANGKNGVTVTSGQTIKIENVSAVDGFDVFAVNNGTLVFDGTVGLNGKIAGTGTTAVDGTLNLSADIENDVRVSAAGVLDVGENNVAFGSLKNRGTIKLTLTDIAANESNYTGGKITVSNAADLDGMLHLTIHDGKLNKGEQTGELQLISASSFTGEFLETLANNLYTVSSAGNGKYVISVKKSVEDLIFGANGTPNNVRTGTGWDKADGLSQTAKKIRDVLDDLAQHDAAGYIGALNALAPSDSRKKVRITSEIGNKIFAEIDKRQQTGRSGGDSAEGMWGRVFGGYSKQDASAENNGFSAKTMGFALGVDGEAGADASIGAGYAFAAAKADGDGKDTDVETHTAFVYGKYQPSDWFVRGAFRFGGGKFHEKANIADFEVTADYTVFHAGAQAFGGYAFDNGMAPQAGLRYTLVSQRKYTDSVGQRVGADTVGVLTAVAGADGIASSGKIGSFDLSVKARAAVMYDVVANDAKSDVQLGDGGYLIVGKRLSRFGTQIGVGLSAKRGAWLVGLDYDADFKRDYFSGAGMLKAQYFL